MKTTKYKTSKSRVMTKAWEMKKGKTGWAFTFSQCLKQAWKEEKRKVERWNDDYDRNHFLGKYSAKYMAEINASIPKSVANINFLANTLTSYYANNMYNGD